MKSKADFKRALEVGSKWHAYHHPMNRDMGVRPVKRVQTKSVTFLTPDGRESWFYLPKTEDLKFIDDKTVEVYEDSELVLTYTLVEAAP